LEEAARVHQALARVSGAGFEQLVEGYLAAGRQLRKAG